MVGEAEKEPSKEFSSKDISDALIAGGSEFGLAKLFSKRVGGLDHVTLEKRIRQGPKGLNEQMKFISTLAKFKDAGGNFGVRGTGKDGTDLQRYDMRVAEEAVKRVTERIDIPTKVFPPTFRKEWFKNTMSILESPKTDGTKGS